MATNKFAARCATCGEAVAPGAGAVTGEVGSRAVTHADCRPPAVQHRSFKVRSSALVPDLLVVPDAQKGEQRRRLLGAVAAISVVALGGLSVLLFTGEDNEGTRRTTGDLQPPIPMAESSTTTTTVATAVAGAVEQRPATTLATLPVIAAPAQAPQPSTTNPGNEVPVVPPTVPTTAPPTAAPTRPPVTVLPTAPPATVPPTVAPTAPPTVPPTVAPTTTSRTTTTRTPATTTTRRRKEDRDDLQL